MVETNGYGPGITYATLRRSVRLYMYSVGGAHLAGAHQITGTMFEMQPPFTHCSREASTRDWDLRTVLSTTRRRVRGPFPPQPSTVHRSTHVHLLHLFSSYTSMLPIFYGNLKSIAPTALDQLFFTGFHRSIRLLFLLYLPAGSRVYVTRSLFSVVMSEIDVVCLAV